MTSTSLGTVGVGTRNATAQAEWRVLLLRENGRHG